MAVALGAWKDLRDNADACEEETLTRRWTSDDRSAAQMLGLGAMGGDLPLRDRVHVGPNLSESLDDYAA